MPIGVMVLAITPLGLDALADYQRETSPSQSVRLLRVANNMRQELSRRGIYLNETTYKESEL